MNETSGSAVVSSGRTVSGCGCALPPLVGIGLAIWLLRDGIPPSADGRTPPELLFAAIAVFVSLAMGAGWFFLGRRRSGLHPVSAQPLTGSRRDQAKGRHIGKLFFGLFFIAGLAFSIPFGLMLWRMAVSQTWEPATCTILSSEVQTHSGDDSDTYSIAMRYRYSVDGTTYEADRYSFSFGSSSGYDGKAEVVAAHPVGSEVPCWVDPNDPANAVISRSVGWEILFILLPLIFVGVGLLGLLGTFGVFGTSSQKREDWLPGTTAEETGVSSRTAGAMPVRSIPGQPGTVDPGELQASSSPGGRLGCSIVVAIFWNGIVGAVAYGIFQDGAPEGCAIVFLGVFALVGLGLLLSVPYYALALANPRLKARIGGALVPGTSTTLSWQFEGKADRIQRFAIKLEGREEARYRRGTDTHTARNTFYENVVFETSDRHRIATGQTKLEIPRGTMHSFDGGNNKIIWTLTFEGDIARWPDVKEDFVVTIRPEGLGE